MGRVVSRRSSRSYYESPRPGRSPGSNPIASPTREANGPLGQAAVRLGSAGQLPAGQGATYGDPGDGQLDIVIRQSNGGLVAHSAICTHAGCAVDYQGGQIVCPCHGSIFNAQTGAVISGPAPTPLAPRKVVERAGAIYAVPA